MGEVAGGGGGRGGGGHFASGYLQLNKISGDGGGGGICIRVFRVK